MRLLFGLLLDLVFFSCKLLSLILPSLLVYVVLTQPEIIMNRGVPSFSAAHPDNIHELIPNTRWTALKPCGQFFNEQEEYDKALSCVNEKSWKKRPLAATAIPRCFVISTESPDIYSDRSETFNFVPIKDFFGNIGAVVGVYQPETKTVFVVENIDAPKVYRHELQHYFLHLHDPETSGGGHHQEIWHDCEEPYYSPSIKAKMISAVKDIDKKED